MYVEKASINEKMIAIWTPFYTDNFIFNIDALACLFVCLPRTMGVRVPRDYFIFPLDAVADACSVLLLANLGGAFRRAFQ